MKLPELGLEWNFIGKSDSFSYYQHRDLENVFLPEEKACLAIKDDDTMHLCWGHVKKITGRHYNRNGERITEFSTYKLTSNTKTKPYESR